ncbi:NACHT domain-containing protein [Amycolatopsis vancoresmycina]|uniref:NACHT domain-containing protein n=1 Tax=Amycolatopsis vancoresmycina TaxID=208444 RepID=UPI0009E060B7|nr:NACHT domain-containing protein [Amycolatopsis vancoresmycina]
MRTWWVKLRAARQTPWWIWLFIAVLLLVSGEIFRRQDLNDQQVARLIQLAGLLVASGTALTKIVAWTKARLRGTPTPKSALESLAAEIFRREELSRYALLADTTSANLTYSDGTPTTVSRPSLVRRLMSGIVRYQDTGGGTRGDLADIGEFFTSLPAGRLIVLGDPGSGKTMMSIELTLQLLKSSDPSAPVPIRLSLAGWDIQQSLEEWLADRLVVDYDIRSASAKELANARPRRLLPILDGLDEMDRADADEPRRALQAIRILNEYIDGPARGRVVLTCRSERYTQMEAGGAALRDSTKVQILPLQHAQIVNYIENRFEAAPHHRQRWIRTLNDHAGVLDEVLSTPWRLHLATTLFDSTRDPEEMFSLRDNSSINQSARIEEFLLDSYVFAATRKENQRRSPKYTPEKVETWLESLAAHLAWQGTIGSRDPRAPAGLSGIDLTPHLLWPIAGQQAVRYTHMAVSVLMYYSFFLVVFGTQMKDKLQLFVNGLDLEVPWVKVLITIVLFTVVLVILPGVALNGARQPWPTPWVRNRVRIPPRDRLRTGTKIGGRTAVRATGFGVITGATMLAVAGGSRQVIWSENLPENIVTAVLFVLFIALAVGIVFGILSLIFNTLSARITEWDHRIEVNTPQSTLRFEPFFFAVLAPLIGALTIATLDWIADGRTPIRISVVFDFLAISFLLTCAVIPAWTRYVVGIAYAAAKGVLPLRLSRFLMWACEAGLLRRSGVSYQFRHLELQHHLIRTRAARNRPRLPEPSPT